MNSQKFSSFGWPVICLIVAGMYGYWAVQRELVSSRPSATGQHDVPDPVPTPGVHTFHSRMWQDPLSTSYAHWKTQPPEARASVPSPVQDEHLPDKDLWAETVAQWRSPISVPPAVRYLQSVHSVTSIFGIVWDPGALHNEDLPDKDLWAETVAQWRSQEETSRSLAAATSGLRHSNSLLSMTGFGSRPDEKYHQRMQLMKRYFQDLVDSQSTICLPVFVPGGPYAEDKEKRMRIRYAVVTALAEAGYSLKYNQRMSYAAPTIHVRVLRGWAARQVVVPMKLYRRAGIQQPQVLVLWVNESELGLRPLLATHRILNRLFGAVTKPENLKVSIVGPASSGTLEWMQSEVADINDASYLRIIRESHEGHSVSDSENSELRQACAAILKEVEDVKLEDIADYAAAKRFERAKGRLRQALEGDKFVGVLRDTQSIVTALQEAQSSAFLLSDELEDAVNKIRQQNDVIEGTADTNIKKLYGKAKNATQRILDENSNHLPSTMRSIRAHLHAIADQRICSAADEIKRTVRTIRSLSGLSKDNDIQQLADEIQRQCDEIHRAELCIHLQLHADQIAKLVHGNNGEAARKLLEAIDEAAALRQGNVGAPRIEKIVDLLKAVKEPQIHAATKRFLDLCDDAKPKEDTVIQRSLAGIKLSLKSLTSVEDRQINTSVDNRQIGKVADVIRREADRIKTAEAYAIVQAMKRIQEELAAIEQPSPAIGNAAKRVKKQTDRVTSLAYQVIIETSAVLELRDRSMHWFVDSPSPVKRIDGFLPLLQVPESGTRPTQVLSPRATMDDLDFQASSLVKLCRIIGTDRQLAESLYDELKLRGAIPGHVVLITEHDTAYGRAIPGTFKKVFAEKFQEQNETDSTEGDETPKDTSSAAGERLEAAKGGTKVTSFRILRGIDGKLPGDDGDSSGADRASTSKSSAEIPEIVERTPEGRTQYDYLRRLRGRIENLQNVKAIGVVGSDVYDKLLVLRAIRPHFPNCTFFTTDLDAIYNHTNERRHTRNLIIASHFGLTLGDDFQQQTPPFRDSYQTATFLATRLAVSHTDPAYFNDPAWKHWRPVINHWFNYLPDGEDAAAKPTLDPVLYIVGREQTHRLETARERERKREHRQEIAALHPDTPGYTSGWHYVFVVGLTLLAICAAGSFVYRDWVRLSPQDLLNNRTNILLGVLIVLGIILSLIVLYRGHYGIEASSFFAGYSSWPRKILQIATGVLALFSFGYVANRFRVQLREIREASQVGQLVSKVFGNAVAKTAILALVIVYAGGVCIYELKSLEFALHASFVVAALGIVTWYWAKERRSAPRSASGLANATDARDRIVFGVGPKTALVIALSVMVGVTLLGLICAILFEESHAGWHPTTNSRGLVSHLGDWLAATYAFVSVVLLFSALLYFQFWCREFAGYSSVPEVVEGAEHDEVEQEGLAAMRDAFRESDAAQSRHDAAPGEGSDGGSDMKHLEQYWQAKYDRLDSIGKLTAVPNSVVPVLMGLLLLLVIAYHPWISPTPMPMGLLVLVSLTIAVFIVSALSSRLYFHKQRDNELSKLAQQLSELDEDGEGVGTASDSASSETLLRQKVEELMHLVEPHGDRAGAAATLVSALLEADEPEEVQTLRHRKKRIKSLLTTHEENIANLSAGVFRSWNRSPVGWIFGGGTALALVDLWIRWWTISF